MPRVVLIHWNAGEAQPRLDALRRWGAAAELFAPRSGAGLSALYAAPPDAFVIDLSRLPSHGRAVGYELATRKATRAVPLLFAGGDPEKVARIRAVLPNAVYASWETMRPELAAALRRAPGEVPPTPRIPDSISGYSGTPLPRKLGIKAGSVVGLVGAPARFARCLEPLPDGARLTSRPRGADRVLLFATSQRDLAARFVAAADAVKPGGGLWLLWPKRASGVPTDLTEPAVRALGLDAGWVDYKICAVDATWSGLLFARRKQPRAS